MANNLEVRDLQWAKSQLARLRKLSTDEQHLELAVLHEAFHIFWKSQPTEEEFCRYMGGIVLTARILYTMVKQPRY